MRGFDDHNKTGERITYEISSMGSIAEKFAYLRELHTDKHSSTMTNALNLLRNSNDIRSARKIAENQTEIIYRNFPSFEKYTDILPFFPSN
jgi:hypothetical protein